jgi:hypothetical protein
VQVAEFLDDEELPAAILDAARRLTFAWASLDEGEAHGSPTAAINELRASLQHRVLALIPLHIVLKHASVQLQKIALEAAVLKSEADRCTACLDSSNCWSADAQVLFGAVSNATALTVCVMPIGGVEWGSHESRWRHEWMTQISGVLLAWASSLRCFFHPYSQQQSTLCKSNDPVYQTFMMLSMWLPSCVHKEISHSHNQTIPEHNPLITLRLPCL